MFKVCFRYVLGMFVVYKSYVCAYQNASIMVVFSAILVQSAQKSKIFCIFLLKLSR